MSNARLIQQTLAQFDIEVALGDITKGPTITRYELHPAPGVKLEKIAALNNNIAAALKESGYEAELINHALKKCAPNKVVVTTPDYESIRRIKAQFPEILAGLTRRHVEQTDADFLCLDQQYVTNEALSFCEQNNIDVWVWTVDDRSLMRRLVASGRIQGLITNRPDRALKLRSARS